MGLTLRTCLQVLGGLSIALGCVRVATASNADCKISVLWDSSSSKLWTPVTNNRPACTQADCDVPPCKEKATVDGWVCRCAGGTQVPDACELVVQYTSDPPTNIGGVPARYVTVHCNNHCNNGGACPEFNSETGNCWDSGTTHVGQAKCPPCQ